MRLAATNLVLAAVMLAAVALAGCGLGAGSSGGGPARLVVTRDFGAQRLARASQPEVSESDTVMRFLERSARVKTRYGGGFVQSIDGLGSSYDGGDGRKLDWFFYVNGVEAPRGAAATRLRSGDRVWWDYHDWSTAMRVPAVVGSFPEPFRSGAGGDKRSPVRVDCAPGSDKACRAVAGALEGAGVSNGIAGLGSAAGEDVIRVVVGPWNAVRSDGAVRQIGRGPRASGVFARFQGGATGGVAGGGGAYTLRLLGPDGGERGELGPGGGLVAATVFEQQEPTWVVTGTDEAGVTAAAAAFERRSLHDRFAVAVLGGATTALPLTGSFP